MSHAAVWPLRNLPCSASPPALLRTTFPESQLLFSASHLLLEGNANCSAWPSSKTGLRFGTRQRGRGQQRVFSPAARGALRGAGQAGGSPGPSPFLEGPAPPPGAAVPPRCTAADRHRLQNPLLKSSLLIKLRKVGAAVLPQVGIPNPTATRPKERRCRREDRPSRRFLCTNNFLFAVFFQDTQPKIAQRIRF